MKYPNNDEYNGYWMYHKRFGEGLFRDAKTGTIERRLYEFDNPVKRLEVICKQ